MLYNVRIASRFLLNGYSPIYFTTKAVLTYRPVHESAGLFYLN